MLVCYSVFKTYVIEKICLFVIPSKIYVTLSSKPMFLCLTQKPHPQPLSVGEGLGVRLYHGSERTKLIHYF